VTAVQPFPLLSLQYLAAEANDKDYALHMDIVEISTRDVFRSKRKWKKLLNSRCRDLLEVDDPCNHEYIPYLDGKVNFLHRTVSDFLRNNYLDELRRRAGKSFDARYSLCKTIIAVSKVSADSVDLNVSGNRFAGIPDFDLVDEMLLYAKDYERIEGRSMAILLDELDRVNTIRTNGSDVHWTNHRKDTIDKYDSCTFLALTIQAGLQQYVKEKLELDRMLINHKRGRPLLDYACKPTRESSLLSQLGQNNVLDPQMVHLLLEFGSDPNQQLVGFFDKHTIWGLFVLSCLVQSTSEENLGPRLQSYNHYMQSNTPITDQERTFPLKSWYESFEFMINHGANPDMKVLTTDYYPFEDANSLHAQKAAHGTLQGLVQGNLGNENTGISIHTMFNSIFGADKAARLALRMEEVAQRSRPPPSIFWRLLGRT
jgi:hypothetical protein